MLALYNQEYVLFGFFRRDKFGNWKMKKPSRGFIVYYVNGFHAESSQRIMNTYCCFFKTKNEAELYANKKRGIYSDVTVLNLKDALTHQDKIAS